MTTYTDMLGPPRGAPKHAGTTTPQSQFLKGRESEQLRNAAGGVTFALDDFTTLRRFLILGTADGTYYASAETMSKTALEVLDRCIAADPVKTVNTIAEISEAGASLRQSPCIFALARCVSTKTGDVARDTNNADPVTIGRTAALNAVSRVLRTFQHLFEFLDYVRRQRGGGAGLHRAINAIITGMELRDLEYQTLKYRNRVGWTPRDLFRFSRPKAKSAAMGDFFAWTVKPESEGGQRAIAASPRLMAFDRLQSTTDSHEAAALISGERLTHEFVPNTLLNDKVVWDALLPNLPLTALVRNLRKMTQVGTLTDANNAGIELLKTKLDSNENLKRARVHPLRLMMADAQYRSGTDRRGNVIAPSGRVLGVLENALEKSWSLVEPLGRRVLIAVDQSGSMSGFYGSDRDAFGGLTPFQCGLALAALYKRNEPQCTLMTYDSSAHVQNVSNNVTFRQLVDKLNTPGGSTDCAAPLNLALKNGLDPEVIILVTDNETWAGDRHVVEALGKLRAKVRHPIAFVTAAVTATRSTVADPTDPHSLEVVGFDPTVPEAIAAHVKEVFRTN